MTNTKTRSAFLVLLLCCFLLLIQTNTIYARGPSPAIDDLEEGGYPAPWLTGPLLAPSGRVIPVGKVNIQPYLYVTSHYGFYDHHWKSHSETKRTDVIPQFYCSAGIVKNVSFNFLIEGHYKHSATGGSAITFADSILGLDFQLLREDFDTWRPSIKLGIKESFPTGKYQKLNRHKHRLDASGTGSFQTGATLVFAKLFHFWDLHFLNTRLAFSYTIPTSVHVKGYNTYGGGHKTHGKVNPGKAFTTILGNEFTLTQNWALALDVLNVYESKSHFSGRKGTLADGSTAKVGRSSLNQISLAPAIEYNFSAALGIIGGVWFTVAGRNSSEFVSGVIALNWVGPL